MKQTLLTTLVTLCMISASAQPTAGLVAYFPMNGNFTDAGPYTISTTNVGATATTNYAGVSNTAMNFSNPSSTVAQYATHAANANTSFGIAQDFTITLSVYVNSPFVHNGGLYDNNLNYSGPGVWYWNSPGYPELRFNFRNGSIGTTNGALTVGTWKHIACVRSGSTMMIYVNGVLNVSGAVGSGTPVYSYPACFGTMYFNSITPSQYNGHHGKIDELRIYNRALTAAEIAGMAAGALPVKLTSFTASRRDNTVTLKWQTQYEQNSSHYIIERSIDGTNFTEAGRMNAAGNSNNPLSYSYNDQLPASVQFQKTIFYRLRSVDVDGKFAYSQVVALNLDTKGVELVLFPNPAKDLLEVQTGNGISGETSIYIYDEGGRRVFARTADLQQGVNSVPVNISLLPKGNYFVQVVNTAGTYSRPFIKLE